MGQFNLKEFVDELLHDMVNHLKKGQKFNYKHTGSELIKSDKSAIKHIVQKFMFEIKELGFLKKIRNIFLKDFIELKTHLLFKEQDWAYTLLPNILKC